MIKPFQYLLLICIFYQCQKDSIGGTGIAGKKSNTFLNVGNKWAYSLTETFKNVTKYSSSYTCFWEVLRQDNLSGKNIKVLRQIQVDNNIGTKDTTYEYYYEDSTGMYLIAAKGRPQTIFFKTDSYIPNYSMFSFFGKKSDTITYITPSIKMLQYPINIGDNWLSNEYGQLFSVNRKYLCDTTINIPLGQFPSTQLKLYDSTLQVYQYFNLQKGLLKEEETFPVTYSSGGLDTMTHTAVLTSTNF